MGGQDGLVHARCTPRPKRWLPPEGSARALACDERSGGEFHRATGRRKIARLGPAFRLRILIYQTPELGPRVGPTLCEFCSAACDGVVINSHASDGMAIPCYGSGGTAAVAWLSHGSGGVVIFLMTAAA